MLPALALHSRQLARTDEQSEHLRSASMKNLPSRHAVQLVLPLQVTQLGRETEQARQSWPLLPAENKA